MIKVLVFFVLVNFVCAQKPSPCPSVFKYGNSNLETGRWEGVITLNSDEELEGIVVNIGLDNIAESMGNWFGESTTRNNKDFVIKNDNAILKSGNKKELKFYVKFDLTKPIPSLEKIRLNGRSICIARKGAQATPDTLISNKPTTVKTTSTTKVITDIKMDSPTSTGDIPATGPINIFDFNIFPGDNQTLQPSRQTIAFRPSEPQCGEVSQKVAPLLVNGFNTSEGQFPWHIAIYASDSSKILRYICGGSLISKTDIVTAAHCVTAPRRSNIVDLNRLQIYLGTSNLVQFDNGVQFRQIKSAKVHPQFNPKNYFNDIAVIKLNRPVDITESVRPICLWDEDTSIDKLINKEGLVVGWGHDGSNVVTDSLKGGYMPIVDTQTCIWSNREFFSQVTFEKNYCAGYRAGANVCNGDSGGGMVFKKNNTASKKTIWQLRGLVSIGVALQNSAQCDPSYYAVFTDVAKHLDFIRDVLANKAIRERYGENTPLFS